MRYSANIISGKGRGKRLNFPTLNLTIPGEFPFEYGIYAGWVFTEDKKYPSAFHFGPIPTFKETEISLEAFIIDTNIETPPVKIDFELITRLRDILTFETPETLAVQIEKDVSETKKVLGC